MLFTLWRYWWRSCGFLKLMYACYRILTTVSDAAVLVRGKGSAMERGPEPRTPQLDSPLSNLKWLCDLVRQVLLKQEGRGHNQVTRTINPSTLLSLPEGGTYIIEVRALSEGGEGAVSSQVRLVTSSGKLVSCLLPSQSQTPLPDFSSSMSMPRLFSLEFCP